MEQRRLEDWIAREARRDADLPALAYRPDGTQVCARLSNISYDGCEVSSDGSFFAGERIRLAIPKLGEVHAEVRWFRPDLGKAGARFATDEVEPQEPSPQPSQRLE